MRLEGVVTNVAAFGAFVDIGVHQDGLVHVSQLADRFIKDPHEVVKAGDVVSVRVTEVDVPRKRIGLTMRKDNAGAEAGRERSAERSGGGIGDRGPGERGPGERGAGGRGKPGQNGPRKGSPSDVKKAGSPRSGMVDRSDGGGNGALGAALLEAMKRK